MPRIKLAHTLLRSDGVIFISIDDRELANPPICVPTTKGKLVEARAPADGRTAARVWWTRGPHVPTRWSPRIAKQVVGGMRTTGWRGTRRRLRTSSTTNSLAQIRNGSRHPRENSVAHDRWKSRRQLTRDGRTAARVWWTRGPHVPTRWSPRIAKQVVGGMRTTGWRGTRRRLRTSSTANSLAQIRNGSRHSRENAVAHDRRKSRRQFTRDERTAARVWRTRGPRVPTRWSPRTAKQVVGGMRSPGVARHPAPAPNKTSGGN
jgi:hypothetical protein